jgi:hypothetical protein
MSMPPELLQTFHLRFFHWVEREWEVEIESGLTRLSRLESVESQSFQSALRALSPEDLRILAVGLNKSRPMGPTAVVGDLVGGLSAEEKARIKKFRDTAWARSSARQLTGTGGAWTSARASRSILRRCLREQLKDVAGEYEEFDGNNAWRYLKSFGPWRVYTYIDVSDRQQQLTYSHTVLRDERRALIDGVSLLSWLGIMGSTSWNTLRTGREVEASEMLRSLCSGFLGALPALLKDLDC